VKVRMKEHRDGSWWEDGEYRDYPAAGEVLETNDIHAADLCRQGLAEPVTEHRKAETRPSKATSEKR